MDNKYNPICNAMLILTNKCNLACKYCFINQNSKEMDLETAKDCVYFIMNNIKIYESNNIRYRNMPGITFFGGEPLLKYKDIIEPLVLFIRKEMNSNMHITFTTNGTLLIEDRLQFFKENRVSFMLSIDGCKEAHDSNRVYHDGTGSFDLIETRIPLILKYFPNTIFRITLTSSNIPYLYESILYFQKMGVMYVNILPNVFEEWSDDTFEEFKKQMELYKNYIINTFEKEKIPIIFDVFRHMFKKIVILKYELENDLYRECSICLHTNRCGIGLLGNATIDSDGNIYTCDHAPFDPDPNNIFYIGDIYNGINENNIDKMKEMNINPLYGDNCTDCPVDSICTGGCVPNNYLINNDFTRLPSTYCKWVQTLYTTALDIIQYFDKDKTNELFKDWFYGVVKESGGIYVD